MESGFVTRKTAGKCSPRDFPEKIRTVERKVNLKVKQAFIEWSMERSWSFPKGAGVDILGKGGKSARAL